MELHVNTIRYKSPKKSSENFIKSKMNHLYEVYNYFSRNWYDAFFPFSNNNTISRTNFLLNRSWHVKMNHLCTFTRQGNKSYQKRYIRVVSRVKNCHPVAFCSDKNRSLTQECVPDVGTNEFYQYFRLPYFKRSGCRKIRKKLTSSFLYMHVRVEKNNDLYDYFG